MSANSNYNRFDVSTPSQRPMTGYRGSSAARPTTSHYNRGGTALSRGGGDLGGSTTQRIGTALGYAGNIMVAERPLTQHGLSGLPTTASGLQTSGGGGGASRLATAAGASRQIRDKRYWQSQLQLKMADIQRETERLARERDQMQRERSAKRSFEQRVQEAAKQLTALQSALTDANIVLDAHTSGLSRQQLQHETAALREHNERSQSQLEQHFHQRQLRSAHSAELQQAVAGERQRLDDLVYSLAADEQQRYAALKASSEQLHAQLAAAQEQDAAIAGQLARLQATAAQSAARTEAVRLLGKLDELLRRRQQLRDEDAARPSPAQEREQLIAEVRDNQRSLAGFTNQLRLVQAQLQERRELLAQIEQDLEEGQSDRHAKYKELKRRDETMSAFMETFAASLERERRGVERLKEQITYGIEQITMQGINLRQLGIAQDGGQEKLDLGSHEGLGREYKRLSVQLRQLQLLEKRNAGQLEELREEERECAGDCGRFGNVAGLREEAAERIEELTSAVEELQRKKATTEGVVEDARERNRVLMAKLTGHERYGQIAHLEERLTELGRSNAEAEEQLAQMRREFDYSGLQAKVDGQLAQVMEMLVAGEGVEGVVGGVA